LIKYLLLLLLSISVDSIKAQIVLSDSTDRGKAQHIDFVPTSFSNLFSLNVKPVLRIRSGDTISTETVDAAGFDKDGVKRQKGGNPLTGPFYVTDAQAGDVLAVTLIKVSLNRSTAFTTESFSSRSVEKEIASQFSKPKFVKWKLDMQAGLGSPADSSYKHLQSFKVPLKPFVGCIGVAPLNRKNEILSFFQGPFGGNLDYAAIKQSSTIYLPVFHDGGYLYVGDGHAVQGDGEIAGNALETSLNISFTVNVIKQNPLSLKFPVIEDSTYIMCLGIDKNSDAALKAATSALLEWLLKNYNLTMQEATQVISATIEYDVAEIADPEIVIAAKIKKQVFGQLIKK
jgi:amidase